MSNNAVENFITEFAKSLENGSFIKLTLGKYRGTDAHLQRILIRLVEIKRGTRLFFLYRYDTRDTAKNFEFAEGVEVIRNLLGREFFAAHLFTTEHDFQLDIGKKNARLNVGKPTFKTKPDITHDREKQHAVNQNSFYLQALGITSEKGEIKAKQEDKWKQINKFVEILGSLFENSNLKNREKLKLVDMGSGKGYLTFAAYDYFNNVLKIPSEVVGVDVRDELISLCNDIARSCDFQNLKFVKGFIRDFELENTDILIALHACNTATDEAIYRGIRATAELIVCSPCCHQEIRPQLKAPAMLKNVLKHGILLEREAETLTDGMRAMLLERSGYQSKIFEFIGTEHTPKNNMLVGTKHNRAVDKENYDRQITDLKSFYGIRQQHLEKLLDSQN
ncbi:MAG: SAM-dependent methyltransferase [Acidobacteriota bacterium]|nr:SAM-dependent methyltransferase [Acidobacteriota bacterium]